MIPDETSDFRAQFGEDKLLASCFEGEADGFYVEVGAYNGVDDSNSYYFGRRGWQGILVEADPELAAQCRANRPDAHVVNAAVVGPDSPATATFQVVDGWRFLSSRHVRPEMLAGVAHLGEAIQVKEIQVPARTLNSILEEVGVSRIAFMTIDIEGYEWDALRGLDLTRWHPQWLLLERNRHFPDWRILNHLHAQGYTFQRTTGVNDWFLRQDRTAARNRNYRVKFWITYCLPKYATFWKPLLVIPLQRWIRLLLIRWGLFQRIKNLRKNRSKT